MKKAERYRDDMPGSRKGLRRLLEKVYCERGFDFRGYRETTLARRLERRLLRRGVKSYVEYARILDKDPTEYENLFNDLTINVTSFFRDEVAFKMLEETVLPTLININPEMQKNLRIWSAGCATGQEPYSIAMLFMEMLGKKTIAHNVRIVATDIDTRALHQAKEGIFSRDEAEAIRPAWRRKYLIRKGESFCVRPTLKQLVTFQVHNLVSNPPYQDLDLVVCRNVLIYFSPPLQMRVLRNFYKGLKEEGFLLLGRSEVPMGEGTALFECVDKKAKLFKKAGIHKFKEHEKEDKEELSTRLLRLIYHGRPYK